MKTYFRLQNWHKVEPNAENETNMTCYIYVTQNRASSVDTI